MFRQIETAAPPDDLVDAREAARIVKAHISSLYRWILSGRLKAYKKAGSRYWVSRAELAKVLAPVVPRH